MYLTQKITPQLRTLSLLRDVNQNVLLPHEGCISCPLHTADKSKCREMILCLLQQMHHLSVIFSLLVFFFFLPDDYAKHSGDLPAQFTNLSLFCRYDDWHAALLIWRGRISPNLSVNTKRAVTVTDLTDQLPALLRFGTVSKYDAESFKKGIRNSCALFE